MKYKQINPNDMKYIVVHCAYTPPDMNIGVADIRRWHRERGFFDVGYHYIIRRDGSIEFGRPLGTMGAHVVGHNHHSVGICLVGGMSEDKEGPEENYTEDQWYALLRLVQEVKETYPDADVIGHNDLTTAKTCPNFDVKEWWETNQFN